MSDELFKKEGLAINPGLTDVAARLKVLEERYNNLVRREQLSEQNLLLFENKIRTELKAVQQRLLETRRRMAEINEKIDLLQGHLATAVQKHEFRVLEAYVDMWRPVDFVTREEAKKVIKEFKGADE